MMKSLNEQIAEVKATKATQATKAMMLFKLGLTKNESDLLVREWGRENRSNVERFAYTFGVEIECYNAYRNYLERTFTEGNVAYRFEGYNHTDSKVHYRFVSDASLTGNNTIECVSPVLKGSKKGFDSLKACCKALNDAGAKVNKSCGLHVHIGAANLTGEQYVNVFRNYQMLEAIIDTFMAESRRASNSRWCKSVRSINFVNCSSPMDVRMAMYDDRYHKVNPCSYTRHKTIEFRQHQGSTDFEKISNWVSFCAKLVKFSKTNVLTAPVDSIDDIPFLSASEKSFFSRRAQELNR